MKIDLTEIVWDPKIYPREKWNTKTIETYVDALKAGDIFPPVVLQTVTNILLDGKHRVEAHKKYAEIYEIRKNEKDTEIDRISEWAIPQAEIDVDFHDVPSEIPLKLYAASLSVKHGDRIKPSERKKIAREIFEANPDFKIDVLSTYIGVSKSSAGGYVSDIRARRTEERKMTAYRLHRLGWTQEEIAENIGTSQNNFSKDFLHKFPELEKNVKNILDSGIPHLDVAERFNMPLILVHAIDLAARTDEQRLNRLKINIQPYDVWNFSKCDDLFGDQHPGRIPGQLIAHVLYFFTKPGDIIFDPMSGSGTTQDVSLAMGRKCYAFDIDPRHERHDIILHNIGEDGWHDRIKKADLLFWDPPYFEKMDKSNIGKDGYVDESISGYSREKYLDFFTKSLLEAKKTMKKGAKLAFLMSDWDDETHERRGIFIWDYADIIRKAGWNLIRQIQTPLSTQQVHPDIVNKFRKSRRLARLERYLLIAEVK